MGNLEHPEGQLFALITDPFNDYVTGLAEAQRLVQDYENLNIADVPTAIQVMGLYPELRETVRAENLNTMTSEFRGVRQKKGLLDLMLPEASYEVVHGTIPIPTYQHLKYAKNEILRKLGSQDPEIYTGGIGCINDSMWDAFEGGEFVHGIQDYVQKIVRLHLEDLKKDDVPKAGTLYSIYVLDKDRPVISPSGRGNMDYDVFMRDDRMLMLSGSLENMETLAKILFGAEKDGGEGLGYVDNRYQVGDLGSDLQTLAKLEFSVGHAVRLGKGSSGLGGDFGPGLFLLMNDRAGGQNYEDKNVSS